MRRPPLLWLAAPLVALTLAGCGEKEANEYPAPDGGMSTDSPVTGPVSAEPSPAAPGYTPPPAGATPYDGTEQMPGDMPPDESTPPDE